MLDPFNCDNSFNDKKSNINISNDHYKNSYSSYGSSGNNNNDEDNKYISISSKYKNDERFASVSSDPYSPDQAEKELDEYNKYNNVKGYLDTALEKTKTVATKVGGTISELDLPSKLKTTGTKTIEVLKTTGSFLYEKGSDIYVK
jgi:hypothetical protein